MRWNKRRDMILFTIWQISNRTSFELIFVLIARLASAESKRFRLGHIRNGKISYRLYPKRKDCVSLNVAIKNLAAEPCSMMLSSD